MVKLFETTRLNGMTLENRFIRSATWTGLAREDGACSLPLTQRMVELVKGGVGLIITGHAYVGPAGAFEQKVTVLRSVLEAQP